MTAACQLLHTHASLGAMGKAPCLHTPWKICARTAVGSWLQVVVVVVASAAGGALLLAAAARAALLPEALVLVLLVALLADCRAGF